MKEIKFKKQRLNEASIDRKPNAAGGGVGSMFKKV